MNEKLPFPHEPPNAVLEIFEFIVSERVQVNPDNSRAMSALTCKLSTVMDKGVETIYQN